MSHLHSSPFATSGAVGSEKDSQHFAKVQEQIAGFTRNLAKPDENTCVPALEEAIAYLRDRQLALLTSTQVSQGSTR